MRKLAIAGAVVSICLLSTTGYLGNRLAHGDVAIKNIHLAFAISGASISVLSHALALVLFLRRPSS